MTLKKFSANFPLDWYWVTLSLMKGCCVFYVERMVMYVSLVRVLYNVSTSRSLWQSRRSCALPVLLLCCDLRPVHILHTCIFNIIIYLYLYLCAIECTAPMGCKSSHLVTLILYSAFCISTSHCSVDTAYNSANVNAYIIISDALQLLCGSWCSQFRSEIRMSYI